MSDIMEHRPYSTVYSLLVHGEDDLVGQIAYAIYKQQKIEKIKRFTTANDRPLRDFLEQSFTSELEEINKQNKSEYDAKVNELLVSLRPKGFMYGVWQGVFASFLFFAAGILLLLATGGWTRIGHALIQLAQ